MTLLNYAIAEGKKKFPAIVFVVFGFVYVCNAWSPSSYGDALNILGASGSGLITGSPKPIRSDEWAVFTPMVQALVHNDFERINKTSFYHEDMRNMFSLPIADWGMLFKPTLASFFIIDPAHAYSLHWFLLIALFVIGYARMFRLTGISVVQSYLVSGTIFYSSFVVGWWTILGPVMAWFPWFLEACRSNLSSRWKFLLVYWVAVCWLLSFFYPPLIISLAFLGLIVLLVYSPDLFQRKQLWIILLASMLSVITVLFYLQDYIQAVWNTIYPGQRFSSGGINDIRIILAQLFPALNSVHYQSLIGSNICEIGVIGTLIPLFTLVFIKLQTSILEKQEWLLFFGLMLMLCWILFPIPSYIGKLLLWDRVPPERMLFAEGLLFVMVCLTLAKSKKYVFSISRIVFIFIAIILFIVYKISISDIQILKLWRDLIVIPVFFVCVFLAVRMHRSAFTVLLSGAFVFNIFINFQFNPIQSTKPIFLLPKTPMSEMLDVEYRNNNHLLAITGFPGAILNGLGYRSVSHVLVMPKLSFWKESYGKTLTDDEFNTLFNRYEHIILNPNISSPTLLQADAVMLPLIDFIAKKESNISISKIDTPRRLIGKKGYIDHIAFSQNKIEVVGWGAWMNNSKDRMLGVNCNANLSNVHIDSIIRPDVVKALGDTSLLYSGFKLSANVNINKIKDLSCRFFSRTEKSDWVELHHAN